MNRYTGVEIAIVGMSGRFPGAADINQFWSNLRNGVESVSLLKEEEIILEGGEDESIVRNPSYVKANAYLSGKEYFDADFFGYRHEEASLMNPQLRIFHEVCWHALEDAGYNVKDNKEKVGIFAGAASGINWDAYAIIANREKLVDHYTATQLRDSTFLCSRIAYLLNLQGPAVYMNTACSTSLVAVQRAVMSLLLRECSMAIAGGITIYNSSKKGYLHQEGMINSVDGHCRTFDADASGTVGGEGAGVVVLKRLEDAIKSRDNIYAVIRGSAVNNDGSGKMSFTAPGVTGQYKVILKAMGMAGVEPESISYVEAHGTATKIGDPIEVEALNLAFGKSEVKYCGIGSVKTNIGHLDAAAGIAGLIKTALSLKHREIPPSLHFKAPNPRIDFTNSPFYVNTTLQQWENNKYPLRAGVSSFGIGGTNAHVILEEAPEQAAAAAGKKHQLLLFSAKSPAALERNVGNFKTWLQANPAASLPDIAYTLQAGRTPLPYRRSFVCQHIKEAFDLLSSNPLPGELLQVTDKSDPAVVFMFPGQGSQYQGMCYDLYNEEAAFRNVMDHCFDTVKRLSGKDLRPIVFPGNRQEHSAEIDNTEYTQPVLFIVEYALAQLLISWGIHPDIMIGHSIGEYVAACVSNALSLEDALLLVIKRGEIMQQVPRGKMLGIAITEKALEPLLMQHQDISLAAVNSTASCVVSGTEDAITRFRTVIGEMGYESRIIRTSHAFHSHMMNGVLDEFRKAVQSIKISTPQIPFISNLSGKAATYEEISDPEYWVKHLRHTVRFSAGAEEILQREQAIFIEAGPGKVLSTFIRSNQSRGKGHKTLNLSRHPEETVNDTRYLLEKIGLLWTYGIIPSWDRFYEGEQRRKVSLPGYSFEKRKYPADVDAFRMIAAMTGKDAAPETADLSKWFYAPSWKLSPALYTDQAVPSGRCTLIFADSCGVGDALINKYKGYGQRIVCVRPGECFRENAADIYELRPASAEDYTKLFSRLADHRLLPDCIIHGWSITPYTDTAFSESAAADFFYSLLDIVKACQAQEGLFGKQVIVLTNNLHAVVGPNNISPGKSLSLSLLTILSQEYPGIRTCHIDVGPPAAIDAALLNNLYREIQDNRNGKVIAFQHGKKWEQVYEQIAVNNIDTHAAFRKGGMYLVTGGLGELGAAIAAWLLSTFSARVALIGRTKLPDSTGANEPADGEISKKAERLQQLKAAGGEVLYFDCNIADAREMDNVMKAVEQQWSAVNGIIHAAGIVTVKQIGELSRKDFSEQFTPKIAGLQVLKEVAGNKELDFCLLASSLSVVLGGLGFGAYGPANIFMDYYINAHKEKGELKNWISVDLDSIDPGSGAGGINKTNLVDVICYALAVKSLPRVVVSTSNLQKKLEKWVYREETPGIETPGIINEEVTPGEQEYGNEGLSATEKALLKLWRTFFNRNDITPDDDFFETGGDSLKALTIVGRIHKLLNVEVPVKEFFNQPTIKKLSGYIDTVKNKAAYAPIPIAPLQEYYPVSSAQKRLHFLHTLDSRSLAYNLPQLIEISGNVDKEKLHNAFSRLIARYEVLRTAFDVVDGETVQRVLPPGVFEIENLSIQEGDVTAAVKTFVRPFDLKQPPLLRVGLAAMAAQKYLLLIDIHHIATDGVSLHHFTKEFMQLYNGEELADVTLQYKDYAVWQQSGERKKQMAQQEDFWLQGFSEVPPVMELPADFPRPAGRTFEGGAVEFTIDRKQTALLKEIADREGATMYMVILSLYYILLQKLCNTEDVVIGVPTAGRPHPDLESSIGIFVNTLALRNYPAGALSFKQFLAQVKENTLTALDNQEYPYEELISKLKLERNINRNPLFDVMFIFQQLEKTTFELPELTLKKINNEQVISKFDLTLSAFESNEAVFLHFEYAAALFKKETIQRFITCFSSIITAVTANINISLSEISILTEADRVQVLGSFNNTGAAYPAEETLVSLFKKQVSLSPDNIAVKWAGGRLSYRELNTQSDQVAQFLQQEGITAGSLVGIMLERDEYLLPGIFGILKAGCAYVPIDPAYPSARINTIVEDAGLQLILSRKEDAICVDIAEVLAAPYPEENVFQAPALNSSALAYVIYTSGSTGKPKGVMITHQSVVNRLWWMQQQYPLHEGDVLLQKTPVVFDVSVWELFWWSFAGASVYLLKPGGEKYPEELERVIAAENISVIHFVPSMLRQFLVMLPAGMNGFERLRYVFSSGEALPVELSAFFGKTLHAACGARLINLYGPTEATVDVSYYECDFTETGITIPIGKPIANHRLYVLDRNRRLLPVGLPGELYISGVGVAQGYLNNQELTDQKFTKDPYAIGESMYQTGDLVKWRSDGNLDYLGRLDDQVKIRGFRIEPGEIERQLLLHGSISSAAVIVKERDGDKYLAAYYISADAIPSSILRQYLSGRLPAYMIPAYFLQLESFPLTTNGKLNKKAFPDPAAGPEEKQLIPATKEEQLLAQVWSKVLGIKQIGITDNFFSVGGDSIQAIRISAKIRAAGYELSVEDIFSYPTIQLLSTRIKEIDIITDQSPVTGTAVLTPIQRSFFETAAGTRHHFNQSVMLQFPEMIDEQAVRIIFEKIQEHHDALRMVFKAEGNKLIQENKGTEVPVWLKVYDLRPAEEKAAAQLQAVCNEIQAGIDLEKGPLMRLGIFHMKDGSRLLIVIHHLVVDGISWRILFEDIATLYRQIKDSEPLQLPLKTDPLLLWANSIWKYTATEQFREAGDYWRRALEKPYAPITRDHQGGNTIQDSAVESFYLDHGETSRLLTNDAPDLQINDVLLAALFLAVRDRYGIRAVKVDVEGHGRERIGQGLNVSRTVGWFTTVYPVVLESNEKELPAVLRQIKEIMRAIPGNGIDYLLGKYGENNSWAASENINRSQICFNYLGQFDSDTQNNVYALAQESKGDEVALNMIRPYDWDISGLIINGQLKMDTRYSCRQYKKETIAALMSAYKQNLVNIIRGINGRAEGAAATDISYYTITPNMHYWVNEDMEREYKAAEKTAGPLLLMYKITGSLDPEAFGKAVEIMVARHESLRATFHKINDRYVMSISEAGEEHKMRYMDVSRQQLKDHTSLNTIIKQEESKLLLDKGPLFTSLILKLSSHEYIVSLKLHHAISDRWSNGILVRELLVLYRNIIAGTPLQLHELKYQLKDTMAYFNSYIKKNAPAHKAYWSSLYWSSLYTQLPPALTIPGAQPPEKRTPYDRIRGRVNMAVPEVLRRKLLFISQENNTTLFIVLQATFKAFLFCETGQHDLLIGTFTSGRDYPETYDQIGCYARTDLVRTVFAEDDSFVDAIRKVKRSNDDMAAYRAFTLMDALNSIMGANACYDDFWKVILLYTGKTAFDISDADDLTEGLKIEQIPFTEQDNALMSMDIILDFRELEDQLVMDIQYDSSTYDEEIINSLFEKYLQYTQVLIKNEHARIRGGKIMV